MVIFDDEYPCMFCARHFNTEAGREDHISDVHLRQQQAPPNSTLPLTAFQNLYGATFPGALHVPPVQQSHTNSASFPNNAAQPHSRPPVIYQTVPSLAPPIALPNTSYGSAPSLWPTADSAYSTQPSHQSPRVNNNMRSFHALTPQQTPLQIQLYGQQPSPLYGNLAPSGVPTQAVQFYAQSSNNHPAAAHIRHNMPLPSSAQSTKSAKLPQSAGQLNAVPQAVLNLGLRAADFDARIIYQSTACNARQYVDISPATGILEEQIFSSNPTTVFGYGNLLRLAAQYDNMQLVDRGNVGRSEGTITAALVKRRLATAIEWANNRPEWRDGVGDVQTWLDSERASRGIAPEPKSNKRKCEDDVDETPSKRVKSQNAPPPNREVAGPGRYRQRNEAIPQKSPQAMTTGQPRANASGYGPVTPSPLRNAATPYLPTPPVSVSTVAASPTPGNKPSLETTSEENTALLEGKASESHELSHEDALANMTSEKITALLEAKAAESHGQSQGETVAGTANWTSAPRPPTPKYLYTNAEQKAAAIRQEEAEQKAAALRQAEIALINAFAPATHTSSEVEELPLCADVPQDIIKGKGKASTNTVIDLTQDIDTDNDTSNDDIFNEFLSNPDHFFAGPQEYFIGQFCAQGLKGLDNVRKLNRKQE